MINMSSATQHRVPLIIRGEVITDYSAEYAERGNDNSFFSVDVANYAKSLTLSNPEKLKDLYDLSIDEIFEFLGKVGDSLHPSKNEYIREAFEMSVLASGLSRPILKSCYEQIPCYFQPDVVREMADKQIGLNYLEGWVESEGEEGKIEIRAFGARAAHIIAGNVPVIGAITITRNAVTRSDAIIKTPSNDPLTAAAIARTMIDLDPDHPVTKHLSVAYWKGGNEKVESMIYQPNRIEKIIAWGGFASIKHISKYLQPGIDLITLDPKQSGTIIGKKAFVSLQRMKKVAERAAMDIGAFNQEGCINARVIYVETGTNEAGLNVASMFGHHVFEAMQNLPDSISTPHHKFDRALKDEINAIRFLDDEYEVIGGQNNEGAVIVSLTDDVVDFSTSLSCRVANIVPVDNLETALRSVNSNTQTIGVYPNELKNELRNRLAFQGGQRIVSLGSAASLAAVTTPQDGIEPMRRMVKWIVDESYYSEVGF